MEAMECMAPVYVAMTSQVDSDLHVSQSHVYLDVTKHVEQLTTVHGLVGTCGDAGS